MGITWRVASGRVLRGIRRLSVAAEREKLEYDLVVVGAGPAGLAAAIRFKQLDKSGEKTVCVVEKGAEVGAHILSGNVFEPRALDELIPDWREEQGTSGFPAMAPVSSDKFYWLRNEQSAVRLPVIPAMNNHGNYVMSLSEMTRWLASKAEDLGVEIYPGFSASEVLYHGCGAVRGIATNDFGVAKDGSHKENYQPGIEIEGQITLLGEGARGSLTKQVVHKFGLRDNGAQEMTYAIGLKEVWEVKPENHHLGEVIHSLGWPLDNSTYGGSFLYHMPDNRVSVGLVIALDYSNPYLSTHGEFQKLKTHPVIQSVLSGGQVLQYGARTLNEGGIQCIPRLEFPGGALIGCAAGFLNVGKIKGTHTAMKSGMLAAESALSAIDQSDLTQMKSYQESVEQSWIWKELYKVRNIRPGFTRGLLPGMVHAGLDTLLFRGNAPWTLQHPHKDSDATKPAAEASPISYPKPDGETTFDILSSVALSGTNHDHDEPVHLHLLDKRIPKGVNRPIYSGPESRYCPARVYEYNEEDELVINAQNCLHCKACDIKDPKQNIEWRVPEGGGGPKYTMM